MLFNIDRSRPTTGIGEFQHYFFPIFTFFNDNGDLGWG
jgi:hypothetical protein